MTGQTDFAGAVLDAAQPVPEGLIDPEGRSAGRRFNVYRNNVAVSLTEALETAFPVLAKLIGEQNFRNLAGLFLRQHPPSSPLMMFYGGEMPAFLAHFAPLQHIGYLPDVARLELALRRSYHAADATPVDPAAFKDIDPNALMTARLRFAPAVRLVPSDWPLHAIWAFNMTQGAPKPQMRPEPVFIVRPEFDPVQLALTPAQAGFVAALMAGEAFGAAAESATAADPDFDLGGTLGLMLAHGAVTALETTS